MWNGADAPLKYSLPKLCLPVAALVLVVSLALPVAAQGQTPTTPRPIPQPGPNLGRGEMGRPEEGKEREEGGRQRERSRDRRDREEPTAANTEATPAVGEGEVPAVQDAPGAGGGPLVIGPGGAPAGGEITGESPVPIPGTGAAPPPARPTVSAPANILVQGEQAFEPAYDRALEFPVLPQVGEKITLEGPMPLPEFLQAINAATGWNIVATDAAQQMTLPFFMLADAPPFQALELLQLHDLYYGFQEDVNRLEVMTKRERLEDEFGTLEPQEFVVRHAQVGYVEAALGTLRSSTGRIIADPRSGHIYVWDTPDNLEQMTKMLKEIDVPLPKREFVVRHADLPDMEAALTAFLSENGRLMTDRRTGQIFVEDSPAALERVAAAFERLDVEVESRTFAINYLNAEDISENVSSLLSERGLVHLDPRTNTLVVSDLPARVERVAELIATLDQALDTRTWTVNYADLDFVADQLEELVPEEMGQVIVNEDIHQITVRATPPRINEIEALINTWDVPRRQVLIEAYIVEVGSEVEREFNINWSYFGSSGNTPIFIHSGSGGGDLADPRGEGESASFGQLPYSVPLYGALQLDGAGNISRPVVTNVDGDPVIDRIAGSKLAVALDYLDQQNKATILSKPLVMVEDGEEAIFSHATQVPYVSATTIYGGNFNNGNLNNTNMVDFIDVGTILTVFPRITDDDNILLEIDAEDSTFILRNIISNDQTSTIPEKTERRVQSQLRVNSGDTVVIGGLRRDRAAHGVTKTPLLGDLPVLGRLFRNPDRETSNNTLLLFLTTTIVDASTSPEAEMIAQAEGEISDRLRHDKKSLWGRMEDRISKGGNEIAISIGQNGDLFSEGKRVTLEQLNQAFSAAQDSKTTQVILRRHPRAPEQIVAAVSGAAAGAGLKVSFESNLTPLVPKFSGPPRRSEVVGNKGILTPFATDVPVDAQEEATVEPLAPQSAVRPPVLPWTNQRAAVSASLGLPPKIS